MTDEELREIHDEALGVSIYVPKTMGFSHTMALMRAVDARVKANRDFAEQFIKDYGL